MHFLIYSFPPILGSFLRKNEQIYLNYVYLGVLFTLIQLFDKLYSITLSTNYSLFGGDIAYSALIFATIYLISSQPEPRVVRNLIYVFVVIALFLFLIFGLLNQILGSQYVENYLSISNVLLEYSFKSLLLSFFLFSTEILTILLLVKKITMKYKSQLSITIALAFAYVFILILDGILYPIGINLLFRGSNLSIINGIVAKSIFGIGFGTVLIGLLILRPHNLSEFITDKTPIIRYLLPPKRAQLEKQLARSKDKIEKLEEIIPICAQCKKIRDDEGYWNQLEAFMSKHKDMKFTHGYCPECANDLLKKGNDNQY